MNKKVIVKSLTAENFLSLDKIKVDFGKLTILVGPNASGKSNIIKALTLLSGIGREKSGTEIQTICKKHLGFESLRQVFYDLREDVTLRLNLEADGQNILYRISFNSEGIINKEEVVREKSLLTRTAADAVSYMNKEGRVKSQLPLHSSFVPAITQISERKDSHFIVKRMKSILANIRAYAFEADRIKSESSSGFNLNLSRDGSNLAQALHSLLTYERKSFLEIEDIMKQLIPEIEEINVPTTKNGQRVYLSIKEKGIPKPLKYHNISDGTLRILAFVTALYLENTIIAFEEPENCVHPYLFETVVDLCRKSPTQVVMTTHSPYLLNKVSDPKEVLLVEKENGRTKVKPVEDLNKARRLLEEGIPLGEIWYMGELQEK